MSKEAKQTVEEAAKAFANKKWPDLKNERQAHVREYAKNDFKAGAEWAAPLPNERMAEIIIELKRRQQLILSEPEGNVKQTMIESFLINYDNLYESPTSQTVNTTVTK